MFNRMITLTSKQQKTIEFDGNRGLLFNQIEIYFNFQTGKLICLQGGQHVPQLRGDKVNAKKKNWTKSIRYRKYT